MMQQNNFNPNNLSFRQLIKKQNRRQLAVDWVRVYKHLGRIPKTTEFVEVGLKHINYYNKAFGNYSKFLDLLKIDYPKRPNQQEYKLKVNPKRFFKPDEWTKFINNIINNDHKFWFELLLHTGLRYEEAAKLKVQDINFIDSKITVLFPKGGRTYIRETKISSYLKTRIQTYIKIKKLNPNSTFNLPGNAYLNKKLKRYCKDIGIQDFEDFSLHNLRKTLEMYGLALGVDTGLLSKIFGHTLNTMDAHYTSTVVFNPLQKMQIRAILDDLWI